MSTRCRRGGTLALITLDNGHDHTRPNTFGPRSLLSLERALDACRGGTTSLPSG